jgi:hypothetical protein
MCRSSCVGSVQYSGDLRRGCRQSLNVGTTAILAIPTLAGTGTGAQLQVPYTVQLGIRATNAKTGFKITTGAAVSVLAVGRFSN